MKYFAIAILAFLFSCGGSTQISRVQTNSTIDLSGYWNDADSRMVSEEMIPKALQGNWIREYSEKHSKKPTVIVSKIKNKTSEHLTTHTFIKDLERALINSGQVKFVASKEERSALREERNDQQSNSSMDSTTELANETGANYMLIGSISSITDARDGEKVIFYQVDLELVDIETNEKVWIGDKKLKKVLSRDKYKF